MKPILLLAVLCCSFSLLKAQVQKLADYQYFASYQIDLSNNAFTLERAQIASDAENKILAIKSQFQNNELVIDYQLHSPGKEGYYVIELEATLNGEKIMPSSGYLLGDLGKVTNTENRQMIWTNFIADLPDSKGQLQLTLKAEWWGIFFLPYGVNCEEHPQFGFREKIPYYAGLTVGVGSLVAGVLIRRDAQKHFDRHKLANTLSERGTEYDAYTTDLRRAEVLTYVGFGIIALDGLFYILRREKHKKRLQVFEEFCNKKSLSISPYGHWPTPEMSASVGLHLSCQF